MAADNVVGHWPGYEIAAPPPVKTMCEHAIKLSLKAYLLDNGIDERADRKFGHDLVGCWAKCIEDVANPDLFDLNILAIISDLLVSGRLRYGEESDLGRLPVFGPLSTLVEASLALCGAPKVSDILSRLSPISGSSMCAERQHCGPRPQHQRPPVEGSNGPKTIIPICSTAAMSAHPQG